MCNWSKRVFFVISVCFIALFSTLVTTSVLARKTLYKPPSSFDEAKPIINKITRQIHNYTLYCGCPIQWTGNVKKGVPDLKTCGYRVRKQAKRARRIEIEHMVPASVLAKGMACWKKGGRKNCRKDPVYNRMAGNLYNLWPSVGEVNADRNNYPYGVVVKPYVSYGHCQMHISFKQDLAEPPAADRGLVARTYLYMARKYSLELTGNQLALYEQWNKKYPPTGWEKKRANAIKKYMGANPYYQVIH